MLYIGENTRNLYIIWRSYSSADRKKKDEGVSWEKYLDIDQALLYARSIVGVNYFWELAAKDYI